MSRSLLLVAALLAGCGHAPPPATAVAAQAPAAASASSVRRVSLYRPAFIEVVRAAYDAETKRATYYTVYRNTDTDGVFGLEVSLPGRPQRNVTYDVGPEAARSSAHVRYAGAAKPVSPMWTWTATSGQLAVYEVGARDVAIRLEDVELVPVAPARQELPKFGVLLLDGLVELPTTVTLPELAP